MQRYLPGSDPHCRTKELTKELTKQNHTDATHEFMINKAHTDAAHELIEKNTDATHELMINNTHIDATHCSLLTAHCSLLTAHCSLLTADCSLLTARCSLLEMGVPQSSPLARARSPFSVMQCNDIRRRRVLSHTHWLSLAHALAHTRARAHCPFPRYNATTSTPALESSI